MRERTRALTLLAAGSMLSVSLVAGAAAPASAAPTTTTVSATPNPATAGQQVTLTATVVGSAPTGQVDFRDSGVLLGSGTVDAGGVATFVVVPGFTVGDHSISADYLGDGAANDPSSSAVMVLPVVAPTPPPPPPPPVTPAPVVKKPKVRLKVSAEKASVGDKVLLRWRSKHADRAMASGDWGGAQKPKGTKRIRLNERGKHVFKLTVENAAGRSTATVKVIASRKAKELELVVTEELVLVGTEVDVDADGLARRETYTVRLDGKPVLTGKADKKGDVHESFVIAKTTAEGVLDLTITGSNPGRVGEAELSVIKPKKLEVEVGVDEVERNGEQTVAVEGLLPGESVTVMYLGEKLTTGKADAGGLFLYDFEVGKKVGERTVKVIGAVPTRVGEATFEILGDGTGPAIRQAGLV